MEYVVADMALEGAISPDAELGEGQNLADVYGSPDQGDETPAAFKLSDLRDVLTVLKLIRLYESRPTRHLVRPRLLELGLDSFTADPKAPGGRSNTLEAEQLLAEYVQHEPAAWERE